MDSLGAVNTHSKWEEMLDEFRALGGTADNIRLDYGPFGRGLFPVDRSKPVFISIPENLLVPVDHVIVVDGQFRVSAKSAVSDRGRAFLERYQQDFAWGAEPRVEIERFLAMMNALPEPLRDLLEKKYGLGKFVRPYSRKFLQQHFFESRAINLGSGRLVMPIIEMVNHGGTANYNLESNVSLRGTFDGEVLVRYCRNAEPIEMFGVWMFASEESMAFSVELQIDHAGRQFRVGRDYETAAAPWLPEITSRKNIISAKYLLLGHQNLPRIPRGSFQKAVTEAGLGSMDETFELIQHRNRRFFLELIGALENVDSPVVPILRNTARFQLSALSSHYGTRQV
jgi:hypothetical protein